MHKNSIKKKERAKREKVLFRKFFRQGAYAPKTLSQTIQFTWNYKGGALFLGLSRRIVLFQLLLELTDVIDVLARDQLNFSSHCLNLPTSSPAISC